MVRRVLLVLFCVCVLGACRVDVTVDLTLGADGTGELVVTAVADADVVAQAPGLAEALRFDDAIAAGWTVEAPTPTADGGLSVALHHPVTSAAEATNLLDSLGPPFTDFDVQRDVVGDTTTLSLNGSLTLPAGFDAFADADLLGAVGGTPFADELAASGATPAASMSAQLRADLAGEVQETSGAEDDGTLVWDAPLDGTTAVVLARTEQRPDDGGSWAGPVSAIALVLLVLWIVVAGAFIVSVARARSRRARARRQRTTRHDRF